MFIIRDRGATIDGRGGGDYHPLSIISKKLYTVTINYHYLLSLVNLKAVSLEIIEVRTYHYPIIAVRIRMRASPTESRF